MNKHITACKMNVSTNMVPDETKHDVQYVDNMLAVCKYALDVFYLINH